MIEKSNMKKFVLINSIFIFLFGFIAHNLYNWFPSFLTIIFPVNESLYEHLKLIFIVPIIIGTILYFVSYKKKDYHNYFFSLFITVLANILIFYAIFLPIYYRFGENMIITFIVYFISILLSQVINYYLLNLINDRWWLNIVAGILFVVSSIVLIYFTYNPLRNPFFFDPNKEVYGLEESEI